MRQTPITEADLHAWLDGLLPLSRNAEIEAYLAARPAEAERLQAYRQQKEALRALFDPVMDEPVPLSIGSRFRRLSWNARRLVAGIAIAMAGGAVGWLLHEQVDPLGVAHLPGPDNGIGNANANAAALALARQAAIAHVVYSPEVRHPVEVGADQEDHLVAWLSKRLGTPVRPPKLGKLGYELIGGRLLPGQSGPVAQFMYNNASGQRLTLYVSTDQSNNRDTGFRFAEEGPVNVFYWIDGKFGYALSAATGKAELARIASAVHEQLEPA
jgi:anti-sigma factor RsiW